MTTTVNYEKFSEYMYKTINSLVLQKNFNDDCILSKSKYASSIPSLIKLDADIEPVVYKIKDLNNKRHIVELKLNFIYSNIIGRLQSNGESTSKYGVPVLLMFFSMLNKLGISYIINYNEHYIKGNNKSPIADRGDVYIQELCPNHIWEKIFDGTEISLCNFLFGNGSGIFSYRIPYSLKHNSPEYMDEINKFIDSISKNNMCNIFNY